MRCPTPSLVDRPVASPRSPVGARSAHAVRTLLGKHRLRRGPESAQAPCAARWSQVRRRNNDRGVILWPPFSKGLDIGASPFGNAPTSGRARLAMDAHRGGAWRAKSPSADPCLATRLRAEGPGSSNAEGVPTNFGASTHSQCGRFVSAALKLHEEVPIATGEIKSS